MPPKIPFTLIHSLIVCVCLYAPLLHGVFLGRARFISVRKPQGAGWNLHHHHHPRRIRERKGRGALDEAREARDASHVRLLNSFRITHHPKVTTPTPDYVSPIIFKWKTCTGSALNMRIDISLRRKSVGWFAFDGFSWDNNCASHKYKEGRALLFFLFRVIILKLQITLYG